MPELNPLAADQALERYFLEARSKLLDVAAILDRISRGKGGADADPRMKRIHEALDALKKENQARAERIQQIFSLPYDAKWEKPKPK
jgi:hypothetical protein